MMAKNFEKELKYGLSRADYLTLLAASKPRRPKRQLNTYFDTPDLRLKKAGAGLRIRIEDRQRAYLTLKWATKNTSAMAKSGRHSRREWECRLPLAQARRRDFRAWQTPIHARLARLMPSALERLRIVGTVRTERTPVRIGRFRAELDAWKVGSHRFYELELETDALKAAEKALRARFRELGIRARPRATTKLATVFRLRRRSRR